MTHSLLKHVNDAEGHEDGEDNLDVNLAELIPVGSLPAGRLLKKLLKIQPTAEKDPDSSKAVVHGAFITVMDLEPRVFVQVHSEPFDGGPMTLVPLPGKGILPGDRVAVYRTEPDDSGRVDFVFAQAPEGRAIVQRVEGATRPAPHGDLDLPDASEAHISIEVYARDLANALNILQAACSKSSSPAVVSIGIDSTRNMLFLSGSWEPGAAPEVRAVVGGVHFDATESGLFPE